MNVALEIRKGRKIKVATSTMRGCNCCIFRNGSTSTCPGVDLCTFLDACTDGVYHYFTFE